MPIELLISHNGEDQVLQVEDRDIISFPQGLVGCPEWKRFVVLEDPDEAPIGMLQCLDDLKVSFLVTDPSCVFTNYKVELPPEEARALELEEDNDGRVLCILSVKENPARITANLLGPIVINTRNRSARQVVLQNTRYSARHPVMLLGREPVGAARNAS